MLDSSPKTRLIAVEEHYATSRFLEVVEHPLRYQTVKEPGRSWPGPTTLDRLVDVGDLRVEEMDAAGLDMQVLSLASPGVQQLEAAEAAAMAREQNDYLADRLKYYPDKMVGLAALPTASPEQAAQELERAVNQYGFKGAAIMGHTRGRYLDDEFFRPILECAAALRVPLFLQPTRPPAKVIEAYYSGYSTPGAADLLATAAWGSHIETAVHALRLAAGGVFDLFPDLQIVIGNLGEGLPSLMANVEQYLTHEETFLERSIGECFRENFYYTTGGSHSLPSFLNLFLQVGVERILFAADYPFGSMEAARAFWEGLPISPADKEKIAHANAERLLGI